MEKERVLFLEYRGPCPAPERIAEVVAENSASKAYQYEERDVQVSLGGEEPRREEERVPGEEYTQQYPAFGEYYDEYAYVSGPLDQGHEVDFEKRYMHELFLTSAG